ncbi:hypothetical protein BDF22DRAFT_443502 [Syncephalis plumigaleata]|nr:hypothetical protein BDF22DRAFT_443502 [Syncephalis plumigaleata]
MPETSSELIKQQLQQSQSQSTSTKSTSRRRSKRRRRLHRQRHVRSINETGGATIDAGLRLQLEIRQENVNEIQVDIQNLKKQEMRAAQALRLAEDEVAYSPDQETQTRLKRAKDGHERIHRALTQLLCDREVQCRFIDQLEQKIRRQERDNADTVSSDSLTADESSRHQARTNDMLTSNDDGDDDSNSEGSGSDTAADDAMLATPLASNIDEQRIMQLERKIRIQREEADEREEALEVQLRSSHEHWRKAEQRLKQEQTNASTQIAQLHERLKGDANRQTQVLQHAEALAEPWQLELPDGHRIYMAAASPSSSDHEGDDDPLNTMNDIDNDKADGNDENVEDATGATVNVRQHRQRRILRALNRARWQRDHLAEHLETYAQELRVQRERNEKLVRVVLEQVRKKLMDEDSTGDLDSAMSMFSRQLDATLNHTALGVSTGLGNGITINGGGGGSNSINGHQPNTHRRRGSSSSVSTSASFRSMPTFGGYFDDPTGQLALNGSTRRPRPRLMAASSSTGNALLRSPNHVYSNEISRRV